MYIKTMHAPHIRKDTGLFYVTVNLCLSFVSGVPPLLFPTDTREVYKARL